MGDSRAGEITIQESGQRHPRAHEDLLASVAPGFSPSKVCCAGFSISEKGEFRTESGACQAGSLADVHSPGASASPYLEKAVQVHRKKCVESRDGFIVKCDWDLAA